MLPRFLSPSLPPSPPVKADSTSMGSGKIMVEFFSAEIVFRVWIDRSRKIDSQDIPPFPVFTCRYLSCSAAGDCRMISAASASALLDLCSPSAATTWPSSSLSSS